MKLQIKMMLLVVIVTNSVLVTLVLLILKSASLPLDFASWKSPSVRPYLVYKFIYFLETKLLRPLSQLT